MSSASSLRVLLSLTEMKNANEKTVIVISHVRKASPAYRTGVLNNGDELVSLNGRKMWNVDDVLTYIDSIHLGEIVNVTVNKVQDIEGIFDFYHSAVICA